MASSDTRRYAEFRKTSRYQSAEQFLLHRIDYERVPKMPYTSRDMNLGRMRRLMELLDDPHLKSPIIHIAGTKGKGSTVAMLASVFAADGLTCGSYTSPHLHFVEERFCINNEPCDPEVLAEIVDSTREPVAEMDANDPDGGPTYFELATAIAFLFFIREKVDVALLEVGLGGRLDSTNVCVPLVSVITSISFDHTKQLGNTLGKIAGEKAGIIKPGVPVVSGAVESEATTVIAAKAAENGSQLLQRGVDFDYRSYRPATGSAMSHVDFVSIGERESAELNDVAMGMTGEHQAANAAVAVATLSMLPNDELCVSEDSIRRGLKTATCNARVEVVSTDPTIIVDAAHNVASIDALIRVLKTTWSPRRRRLLLGTTKGKDVPGMLRLLLPAFDEVVCARYENNPRGWSEDKLAALATEIADELRLPIRNAISSQSTPANALRVVREKCDSEDLICVTGSFFIAAEIRELLDRALSE